MGVCVLDDMGKIYSIGEVAEMFDRADATIRKYEKDFDINIPRNELGHRYYTDKEIKVFEQIVKLKEQGANLHVINNLLNRSVDYEEQQEESLELITMDKMTGQEVKQLLDSYLSGTIEEKQKELKDKYDKIENELDEVKEQNEKLIDMIQNMQQKQNKKKSLWDRLTGK